MAMRMARRSVFAAAARSRSSLSLMMADGGPATSTRSFFLAVQHRRAHRSYATTNNNNHDEHSKNRRISRNLYRELLRWCQTNQLKYPDSVLEYMGIPPVSFSAPEDVDAFRLELLYEAYHSNSNSHDNSNSNNSGSYDVDALVVQKALRLLPPKCDYGRQQLVAPVLSFSGLRGLVRAMFRLNHVEPPVPLDDSVAYENLLGYEKKRRTAAFHALKSFNELMLADKLGPRRWDRDGVTVRMGQIVQHREERWRGVVVEWNKQQERTPQQSSVGHGRRGRVSAATLSDDFSKLTTLTTKNYSLTMEESENDKETKPPATADADANASESSLVRCTVLLDVGDAFTLSAPMTRTVSQSELDPVTEPQLCRIRSIQTQQYFVRYNAKTNRFVPNPLLAYQYPRDGHVDDDASEANNITNRNEASSEYDAICEEIAVGVQEFAAQLNTLLFDSAMMANNNDNNGSNENNIAAVQPSFNGTAYDLLAGTQRNLYAMAKGDVLPAPFRFQSDISPATMATLHLKALSELSHGLFEILDHRRQAIQTTNSQFTVGDIVRHKKYGFRGVVLAWDPTPVTDVSRWDGLQDIVDPQTQPFYHVLPDQHDCRDVFGGERPMRYVCQENLELLVNEEDIAGIEIENVDSDWHWQPGCRRYEAPAMIRFKHGQDLGDHGAFERCLERLEDAINEWQFKARQDDSVAAGDDVTMRKLSMRNLLQLLHAVDNVADAAVVEDLVKDMRKAHLDKNLRSRLEQGLASMVAGRANDALEIFESVLEQDPNYAEAWNKLATTEYMLGKYSKSLESTDKALQLDPLHFQARNGMGLVLFEKGQYQEAADCFRKSLERNPWAPGSSRLSMCVDLLSRMVQKEELPF